MTNKTQLKIGLIIADNMEFKPFAEYCAKIEKMREGINRKNEFITVCLCKGERTIELTGVKCGVGKVNAAMSASFQIANGANLILNSGLSGGIANVRRPSPLLAHSPVPHSASFLFPSARRGVKSALFGSSCCGGKKEESKKRGEIPSHLFLSSAQRESKVLRRLWNSTGTLPFTANHMGGRTLCG